MKKMKEENKSTKLRNSIVLFRPNHNDQQDEQEEKRQEIATLCSFWEV